MCADPPSQVRSNPGTARAPDDIAVIVPHYNDTVRLRRCLEALFSAGVPGGTRVVVVDNNSTEDVTAVLGPFPGVHLVVETERGAAAARNRGVRETTAPIIAFLDADCVPSPTWLATVRALRGKCDIVGGRVNVFCESPPPRSGAEAFETVLAFNQSRYVAKAGFSVTANLVTRRDLFNKVGGFSPAVSEDVDWCRRATALGYQLSYAPDLVVSHPARLNWCALRSKWLRLTKEAFALHRQNGYGATAWAARAAVVLISPVREIPSFLTTQKLDGLRERASGLATLIAIRTRRSAWMMQQACNSPIS